MDSAENRGIELLRDSVNSRKEILNIIYRGNASHIGSSFSIIEILNSVYGSVDIEKIKKHADDRDRIVVSKGHSAAAVYVAMSRVGLISRDDLETYHANGSLLSGHVSHFVPYVEHSTGALGHGLSVATGICIGLKSKGYRSARTFVIVGDGELHEGSNWEAIMLAGHLNLNNLCVLVDNNKLGGIGKTCECCSINASKSIFESFGFKTFEIGGHDEKEIRSVINETKDSGCPVAIICHTVKGKGVSFMEGNNVWHYRPPDEESFKKIVAELKGEEE